MYTKAAEKGHVKSQERLGYIHMKGNGVPVNIREAIHWYELAVEPKEFTPQMKIIADFITTNDEFKADVLVDEGIIVVEDYNSGEYYLLDECLGDSIENAVYAIETH